jgi:hypothetical protein
LKNKILVTLLLYLFWIIAGAAGLLPSFSRLVFGDPGHSILAPVFAIADVLIYVLITHAVVMAGFAYFRKNR